MSEMKQPTQGLAERLAVFEPTTEAKKICMDRRIPADGAIVAAIEAGTYVASEEIVAAISLKQSAFSEELTYRQSYLNWLAMTTLMSQQEKKVQDSQIDRIRSPKGKEESDQLHLDRCAVIVELLMPPPWRQEWTGLSHNHDAVLKDVQPFILSQGEALDAVHRGIYGPSSGMLPWTKLDDPRAPIWWGFRGIGWVIGYYLEVADIDLTPLEPMARKLCQIWSAHGTSYDIDFRRMVGWGLKTFEQKTGISIGVFSGIKVRVK